MVIKTKISEKQIDSSLKKGGSLQEILSEEYCNLGGVEFLLFGLKMPKNRAQLLTSLSFKNQGGSNA